MVRERGLAVCAVVGNIVTSWSWFGVNMLGIGLHSYGFMDAAFKWLMAFVASQLSIIALGLLPLHLWVSFRSRVTAPKKAESGAGKPAPAAYPYDPENGVKADAQPFSTGAASGSSVTR